ncbi:unnamed protein product [Arabidopsis lyrata]|uniref:DUF3700 domain-containing protein n=1 Tax=Arabidopsis lyrata subsp. lyrata TaxID=81972 RepID=D7LU99_ARALL|nr:hypothetical protein ARALYDRAFT_906645 [Arabidopsis lyrata subsp. lyrata]CAH8268402.1 unnamed protein product [Arabidopsis lyrata]
MLGVFSKQVAPFPELDKSLNLHTSESVSAMENSLAKYYTNEYANSFMVDIQPWCMLAITVAPTNSIIANRFQAKDDMFCILSGSIENIDYLASKFHFNKDIDQPTMFIEAYKSQRRINDGPETKLQKDQREFYWLNLVRAAKGKFTIILFDNLKKTVFAATDRDAHLPFYWGIDVEGDLILTTNSDMAQLGCQRAYGSFPRGCYISTSDGLKTFDDQNTELHVEEDVDSVGVSYLNIVMVVESPSSGSGQGSTESVNSSLRSLTH